MQTKDDTLDRNVPYVVCEAILGRHERIVKRLTIANIVMAVVTAITVITRVVWR